MSVQKLAAAQNGMGQLRDMMGTVSDIVMSAGQALRDDTTVSPATIAEFYFHLRTLYDEVEEQFKKIYHVHDMLNKNLIPERLKDAGMDAIRVPSVARSFSIVTKMSATMLDKERGLNWLREIGQEDMIQTTVNAGTLSAFVRNMILEEGKDPPADLIKVSSYNTTSMVKYRPKAGEV